MLKDEKFPGFKQSIIEGLKLIGLDETVLESDETLNKFIDLC